MGTRVDPVYPFFNPVEVGRPAEFKAGKSN
jgi:hypothetical protein